MGKSEPSCSMEFQDEAMKLVAKSWSSTASFDITYPLVNVYITMENHHF
jgi:hypothetical protein